MEKKEAVKVEILSRRAYFGTVLMPGEIVDARILADGVAQPVKKPFIKLRPNEYRVFIAEQEFEKLLRG